MSEPRFCYRHPTRLARRRCFECSRPLCPECQLKADHHLFCGEACRKSYQAKTATRPRRPYARYALYAAGVVLFVAGIWSVFFADAFYSSHDRPSQAARPAPSAVPADRSMPAEAITITRPVNGMTSPAQTIEVEGKAPGNSVVAVYLNGTLVESTVARQGVYHFNSVLLTKHANVVQTRYYDTGGSSNFSPAIMVLFDEPIQNEASDWKFFQNSGDNISRGNPNRKEIALTFDGGSEADSCQKILKTLKDENVRATVFLTGEFMQQYPDLTRQIAGTQEVGNHTYSHEHFTTFAQDMKQRTARQMTRDFLQEELRKTEQVYLSITGQRLKPIWRAPYGEENLEIRRWAAELGYMHIAWTSDPKTRQNMDSLDWVPNASYPGYFPAMVIKDRILSFGQNEPNQANGAIILMHLGSQRDPGDRLDQWLPEIIKTFRKRGYTFLTASQIIDHMDLLPQVASK